MTRRVATIMGGPSVWVGLRGWLISEDAAWVVCRVWAKDDAGTGVYDVRMPSGLVKIEDENIPE